MNYIYLILKFSRKLYNSFLKSENTKELNKIIDKDNISFEIQKKLNSNKPIMIARFGATELMTIKNYLGVKRGRPNIISYIKGHELDWWWNNSSLKQIEQWSGFFPPTIPNVEKFCELMLKDTYQLDILVSWISNEKYVADWIKNVKKIQGLFLDPFWSVTPWTKSLRGKKVLVIHPFAETIKTQYKKRELLFENKDVLPEFQLRTIKAVQSLGGKCEFGTWFEALDYMKKQVEMSDFDIALIAAGAYGFPLAAHVKKIGKKAVHMGGSLQLLFGIKGKRWEDPDYGMKELGKKGCYKELMNDYWVYPGDEGKPINVNEVEGGCYW